MLDDEARRTLEEEAIALVNLSNPKKMLLSVDDSTSDSLHYSSYHEDTCHSNVSERNIGGESEQRWNSGEERSGTGSHGAIPQATAAPSGGVHPLLQVKANLLARRRGNMSARNLSIRDPEQNSACLSMEVYVNNAQAVSAANGSDDLKLMKVEHGDNEHQWEVGADGNISMKSLLVTLKKRKTQHPPPADDASNELEARLPSFRDVFESPQQQQQHQQGAPTQSPAAVSSSTHSAVAGANATAAGITPAELKCKYRTGKCNNARALKSCGDYHNLCNYHRLRANANQRKLDRKKKVQRQQLTVSTTSSATSSPLPSGISSSVSATIITKGSSSSTTTKAKHQESSVSVRSSAAAAAALASLPTSLLPHHPPQRPFEVATLLPYYPPSIEKNSNSMQSKQQDTCSY